MNRFMKILYAFFPLFDCNKKNKEVRAEKNEVWEKFQREEETEIVTKFKDMKEEDAKYLMSGVRDNIRSLEDRAKITAVAVTLAFSLVGGISAYMINLKDYSNGIQTAILVISVILSCFYLIASGYYALITLNSKPKYDFSPEEFSYLGPLSEEEYSKEALVFIGQHYHMTSFDNTIINNYVDCSNNNLRNALISLGIFISLICFSLSFYDAKEKQAEKQARALAEQTTILKDIMKESQSINKELDTMENDNKQQQKEIKTSLDNVNTTLGKTLETNNSEKKMHE